MTAHRPSSLGAAAAAFALVALAVAAAGLGDPVLADRARAAPPALVSLAGFLTAFGTSEYMFAYSGLIAVVAITALGRGHVAWHGGSLRVIAERAVYFFTVVAASGLVDQVLKHAIGRARPTLVAVDGPYGFHPMSLRDSLASFPSGHTTSAFAAAVALSYMRPDWRGRLIGAALLIGASRVLVGAHYPSDVVGGAALGSGVAFASTDVLARRGLAFTLRAGRAAAKPLRPPKRRTTS